MKLYFVRSLGYYITQIYIPSTLIVILSWVSFWLDRTAAPARVSLGLISPPNKFKCFYGKLGFIFVYSIKGITTVLTMVTFIWSTNASLPKISYIKGIDVYLVTCFAMTFLSVIEYGTVSYVHRRNEKKKKRLSEHPLQEIKNQTPIYELTHILQPRNQENSNKLK